MVTMGQHGNHDNGTATWKSGLCYTHGNSSGQHGNQDNATPWKHI